MTKIIDRVFRYNDSVIAIALYSDFGVVLEAPDIAPDQILAALAWNEKGTTLKSCTRYGSNGPGLLIGYMIRHLSGRRRSASITSSFAG